MVQKWCRCDEPVLFLRLRRDDELPDSVRTYLDSPQGQQAKKGYKCRNRNPWYVVPDVSVPDAFLSYMSGNGAAMVANRAQCVGTNSVHVVNLKGNMSITKLLRIWREPFTQLSCEVEGHPLGGGMLKIEPREASRIVLLDTESLSKRHVALIKEGIDAMRRWRHYG
ncbi:MAG: SAM-dependent DNA methyltransferase, partial [Planctomycetota bacterium]|nr:SAM-dependent DNA methyltransferase [Planctomycetota bacterium]